MNRFGGCSGPSLISLDPFTSLSVDTLSLLKEDQLENRFVIVIVDNFSKLVGLYPAQNTTSKEFVWTLLQWVSILGAKEIRTDGGSHLTSQVSSNLCSLLVYHHLVVVAYHPQAKGSVKRRNTDLLNHLPSLMYEKRIRDVRQLSPISPGNP